MLKFKQFKENLDDIEDLVDAAKDHDGFEAAAMGRNKPALTKILKSLSKDKAVINGALKWLVKEDLDEAKQLGFDFGPGKVGKAERGDGTGIVKGGLKIRGLKTMLGVGDWVSVGKDGFSFKIMAITKGQIRLDNGKLYGPKQLHYTLDEGLSEARAKTASQDKYTVHDGKKIIKNNMTRAAAMKMAKDKGLEYGSSAFVHDKMNDK
tara:strand:+ start:5841 stop:6461 length:621 start_codon:yes stop_codon:yes gene_type:complete